MAATVRALAVTYYGPAWAEKIAKRWARMVFFVLSFLAAAGAGIFGAIINLL